MEWRVLKHPNTGLTAPAFCANPFGCVAGATPWESQREMAPPLPQGGRCVCPACRDLAGHGKCGLLTTLDLRRRINHCPTCHWLFGWVEPRGYFPHIGIPSFQEWTTRWASYHRQHGLSTRPCLICGFIPDRIGRIAVTLNTRPETDPDFHALVATSWEILRLCLGNVPTRDLRTHIHAHVMDADFQIGQGEQIVELIRDVTAEKTLSRDVLLGKLTAALHGHP